MNEGMNNLLSSASHVTFSQGRGELTHHLALSEPGSCRHREHFEAEQFPTQCLRASHTVLTLCRHSSAARNLRLAPSGTACSQPAAACITPASKGPASVDRYLCAGSSPHRPLRYTLTHPYNSYSSIVFHAFTHSDAAAAISRPPFRLSHSEQLLQCRLSPRVRGSSCLQPLCLSSQPKL